MARLKCKCGEDLSNSNNPEIEYLAFNNKEWSDLMDSNIKVPVQDIKFPKTILWICPVCKRLYYFEENIDRPFRVFKIEEEESF